LPLQSPLAHLYKRGELFADKYFTHHGKKEIIDLKSIDFECVPMILAD
jgi:hypothetical protein